MKNYFVISLLMLMSFTAKSQQVIDKPHVDYSSGNLEIKRVELTADYTIIDLRVSHKPNYWYMIAPSTVLRDSEGGKDFKLIKSEGYELGKRIGMPECGYRDARLFFEPVGEGVKAVDYIEPKGKLLDSCYGIQLSEKEDKGIDAFMGNWYTTNGTNHWVAGVTDTKLLYKNEIWDYTVSQAKARSCKLTASVGGKHCVLSFKKELGGKISVREGDKGSWALCDNKFTFVSKDSYWSFDPNRHKDSFFTSGKALVRGVITNYSPKTGIVAIQCKYDAIELDKDVNVLVEINEDGTFEFVADVNYPTQLLLHDISSTIYVEAGDTTLVSIDLLKEQRAALRWGKEIYVPSYMSSNQNSADINNLQTESTFNIFDAMPFIGYDVYYNRNEQRMAAIGASKTPLEDLNKYRDESYAKMSEVLATASTKLSTIQTSDYVKDYFVSYILANIMEHIFDFEDDYIRVNENKPNYVPFDAKRYYDNIGKYTKTVFNNPQAAFLSWSLVNRYEFSALSPVKIKIEGSMNAIRAREHVDSLFNCKKYEQLAKYRNLIGVTSFGYISKSPDFFVLQEEDALLKDLGEEMMKCTRVTLSNSEYYAAIESFKDAYGVENNLVLQCALTRSLEGEIQAIIEGVDGGGLPLDAALNFATYNFNTILPLLSNEFLRMQALKLYSDKIAYLSSGKQEVVTHNPLAEAALARIIEPYKGNALFIDFWGLG